MPEDKDDFESAFAEFSKPEPADQELPEEEENEPEQEPEDGESEGEKPEDQPTEGQQQEPDTELAKLMRERDEWRHRYQSDMGRIAALQRKVAELQDSRAPARPSQEQIQEAMGSDEGWKTFTETYPDIAAAIDKRFERERNTIGAQVEQSIAPIRQSQEQQYQIEQSRYTQWQYDLLGKEHPDYMQVVKTKEFADWRDRQRPAIQSLFDSEDYRDAAEAIRIYKMETQQHASPPQPSEVANIRQERERRLDVASAPPTRSSAAVRSAVPADDFEAAFQAFAARKMRSSR